MDIQTKIYNFTSLESKPKTLPKEIFGMEENKVLLAEVVRVYLFGQRKARAKTKTRAEVSGSGRKIWRQKGTGRARHGDQYAPIFVGGGVAHGPTGRQNWKLNFPKKKKEAALKVALSSKLKEGSLILIDDFGKVKKKTKEAYGKLLKILQKANKKKEKDFQPRTTLVFGKEDKNIILPFRNIPWVKIVRAEDLNPYFVLENKFLILEEEALKKINKRLIKK